MDSKIEMEKGNATTGLSAYDARHEWEGGASQASLLNGWELGKKAEGKVTDDVRTIGRQQMRGEKKKPGISAPPLLSLDPNLFNAQKGLKKREAALHLLLPRINNWGEAKKGRGEFLASP